MDRILMVSPEYFDVLYSINPHMVNKSGELHEINYPVARRQWEALKRCFENIGLEVFVLPGQKGLPDMVFAANQCLPVWLEAEKNPKFLMSKMNSPKRQPEVSFFRQWFQNHGYGILELGLPENQFFEGMGDVFWNPDRSFLWGGWGFRTTEKSLDLVSELVRKPVRKLKLKNENFYHLDTCFLIINDVTAALYEGAFDTQGLEMIDQYFSRVIRVSEKEALQNFACNGFSPDGIHVVLQEGSSQFIQQLKDHNFIPIEVDTGEFIKAGGSVFCLKLSF